MPFPRVLADGRVEINPGWEFRGFDPFKLIIRIMSIYVPVVIARSDCGHPKNRTLQ